MSRLVIVSNRVAPSVVKGRKSVGGLASALSGALQDRQGLWFGWSGEVRDDAASEVRIQKRRGITTATVDLTSSDYEDYYAGFANQTIWPLFHYRTGLAAMQRSYLEGYFRVNTKFAQHLMPLLRPDDIIWIHDYHLIPLARELRAAGAKQRIGFFLHIPWPAPEILYALPKYKKLVECMFDYDLIGFQTEGDAQAFVNYAVQEGGGRELGHHEVECFGKISHIGVFPVGCDAASFAQYAESDEGLRHATRMRESIAGRDMILGVDRLDYSKGIDRRFRAYADLLKRYEAHRRHVFMLQIAPASRADVPEYQEIKKQLEWLSGQINGEYADYDWVPLRYVNQVYSPAALASMYRASKVALITPLRDGMNLVAKEFIVCQDKTDPGVLILSRFAGAAQEMKQALIVNPFDEQEVADALHRALTMPVEERQERWHALYKNVLTHDVKHWVGTYVDCLAGKHAELRQVS